MPGLRACNCSRSAAVRGESPQSLRGGETLCWFHLACGACMRPERFLLALQAYPLEISERSWLEDTSRIGLSARAQVCVSIQRSTLGSNETGSPSKISARGGQYCQPNPNRSGTPLPRRRLGARLGTLTLVPSLAPFRTLRTGPSVAARNVGSLLLGL